MLSETIFVTRRPPGLCILWPLLFQLLFLLLGHSCKQQNSKWDPNRSNLFMKSQLKSKYVYVFINKSTCKVGDLVFPLGLTLDGVPGTRGLRVLLQCLLHPFPAKKINIMNTDFHLPYSRLFRISPWLTEFGPLLWQPKQTVSALCQLQPAT